MLLNKVTMRTCMSMITKVSAILFGLTMSIRYHYQRLLMLKIPIKIH